MLEAPGSVLSSKREWLRAPPCRPWHGKCRYAKPQNLTSYCKASWGMRGRVMETGSAKLAEVGLVEIATQRLGTCNFIFAPYRYCYCFYPCYHFYSYPDSYSCSDDNKTNNAQQILLPLLLLRLRRLLLLGRASSSTVLIHVGAGCCPHGSVSDVCRPRLALRVQRTSKILHAVEV